MPIVLRAPKRGWNVSVGAAFHEKGGVREWNFGGGKTTTTQVAVVLGQAGVLCLVRSLERDSFREEM